MIGIYKITNLINGHSYIGKSKNIYERWSEHKRESQLPESTWEKNKRHEQTQLHKAMRKYGVNQFSYEIIEECSLEELDKKEIYWIAYYNTYLDKNHYNMTPGGDGYNCGSGENAPGCKITQQECNLIKEGLKNRMTANEILKIVPNATRGIITSINYGHSWFDLNETYPLSIRNGNRLWSQEEAMAIRQKYSEGINLQDLAEQYGGSPDTIKDLISGKTYSELPLIERTVDWKRTNKKARQLSDDEVRFFRKEAKNNSILNLYNKYKPKNMGYSAFRNMIVKNTYKDVLDD